MLGQNRSLLDIKDSEENFWPSFTDLLSVIILVIMLLLVSYIFQAQYTTKESREMEEMIVASIMEVSTFRENIASDLSDKFSNTQMDINIDENTGAISFTGDILFEFDSDIIRPEFKAMLEEFIPTYLEVLLAEDNKDYISQIIIEGHTDDRGDYLYNLDLSQRRASNVVKYILGDEFPDFKQKDELKYFVTANGKANSALIEDDVGKVDRIKSRRVEIKFSIKDQYFIDNLKNIINS